MNYNQQEFLRTNQSLARAHGATHYMRQKSPNNIKPGAAPPITDI